MRTGILKAMAAPSICSRHLPIKTPASSRTEVPGLDRTGVGPLAETCFATASTAAESVWAEAASLPCGSLSGSCRRAGRQCDRLIVAAIEELGAFRLVGYVSIDPPRMLPHLREGFAHALCVDVAALDV